MDHIPHLQSKLRCAEAEQRMAVYKVELAKEALAAAYRAKYPIVWYCDELSSCWSSAELAKIQLALIPSLVPHVAKEMASRHIADNELCLLNPSME